MAARLSPHKIVKDLVCLSIFPAAVNPSVDAAGKTSLFCTPRHMMPELPHALSAWWCGSIAFYAGGECRREARHFANVGAGRGGVRRSCS
jgi:hypothetical protein